LLGYDTHIDATNITNNNVGEMRHYFFSLPIGEGEFTSYLNREDGEWDFVADTDLQLETTLTIETRLDDVGFQAGPGEEILMELNFSL